VNKGGEKRIEKSKCGQCDADAVHDQRSDKVLHDGTVAAARDADRSIGARRSVNPDLGWRSQRFLREVEAIRHIVGSLISCIQWLQPKRNF